MLYKVVERFVSPQGEGFFSGTQMDFIRMSQCPVGGVKGICKLWDGKEFICDTGASYKPRYKDVEWHPYTEVNEELSEKEIVGQMRTRHLCLTGGEPFVYDLWPIVQVANDMRVMVHVETSGTVVQFLPFTTNTWITLSPKQNYHNSWLSRLNELKLLVHWDTSDEEIQQWMTRVYPRQVPFYLQPIEDKNWMNNTERAIKLLELDRNLRLSVQLHKMIHVR